MLTYSFADLQGESMYAHLYKCIKNDITNGVLHAKEKLPSKRMLAKNLGISLITVENAYAQLVVEGYIYSQPKRGYYVARIEQQPLPVKAERKAAPSLKPQATAQSVSFAKSSVPPDTFPYNIWARLLRNTLTTADEHAHQRHQRRRRFAAASGARPSSLPVPRPEHCARADYHRRRHADAV